MPYAQTARGTDGFGLEVARNLRTSEGGALSPPISLSGADKAAPGASRIRHIFTQPRAAALVVAGALLLFSTACRRSETEAGKMAAGKTPPTAPVVAVLETDRGTIEIELLPGDAPKTVENFRRLAERGYYDGLTFHRIVKGFMIQGGDPLGDGRGGESAWGGKFDDEIKRESPLYERGLGYRRGVVAMANAGPNTNGSQFFILHRDHPMAPSYTIFGKVTKGLEVVDVLAELPTQRGADSGMSRPVTPPVMRKVRMKQ